MASDAKESLATRLVEQRPDLQPILTRLMADAPGDLFLRLGDQDGAARLAEELAAAFAPGDVTALYTGPQVTWEQFGAVYSHLGRHHEAMALFLRLYDHLLSHQTIASTHVHKGVPLYWVAICHAALGNMVLAKRYLMLTLCEDAVKDRGTIDFRDSGTYFRLVWQFGLPDADLRRYVSQAWELHRKHSIESRFPEWTLQHFDDQDWMVEVPVAREIGIYRVSSHYVRWLLEQTEDRTGKNLEVLAQYLIGAMPGCRALRRVRSEVSDYDVVGIFEGSFMDFRSELGRYFLAECKDWSVPADFSTVAKFCRVLDSAKCRFGILFSREGVSGQQETRFAEREIVKVFQDRGIIITVVTKDDLARVASGESLIIMLRSKYERVRLDLPG